MTMATIEVPEDLLNLLKRSRLGERPLSEHVRVALAIQLFQEGVVSVGKAAVLAGAPRLAFESLLAEMGIPPARFDLSDYEQDIRSIEAARGLSPPT